MERDFYRDEFEQLLKDSTDEFKMYPSRRVWHSIYNDLHPDRKWPSLAVCLLLLTAILYVGVSNNNSINSASRKNTRTLAGTVNTADNNTATSTSSKPEQNSTSKLLGSNNIPATNFASTATALQIPIDIQLTNTEEAVSENRIAEESQPEANNQPSQSSLVSQQDGRLAISVRPSQPVTNDVAANTVEPHEVSASKQVSNSLTPVTTFSMTNADLAANDRKPEITGLSPLNTNKTSKKHDTQEKEWIENFAFHNQPQKKKKLLAGYEGEFYLTPGVGYRVMFQNSDYKKINNSLVAANSAARYEEPTPLELNQQIGLTMEMGGLISKSLNKRLRVKTGLQLNITDYITYAKKLDKTGQTMLALTSVDNNSISLETRSTNYANVPGDNNSQLHNKTIQISVPVGADYKLLSTKNIAWHVGGSIQPTYVASGYAYLVSADNNYFIEDPSMLRRWNLNGAIESFVSIKTKSGAKINLGPQFRYSLLSTYKNSYSYTEKPYSVGFKIGFSKSF